MFKQKEWHLIGNSGRKYSFTIHKKSTDFHEDKAVYVLAYTHPKGHLAGFETHPLLVAETTNLNEAINKHFTQQCLKDNCWNSILILNESQVDAEVVQDLYTATNPPC